MKCGSVQIEATRWRRHPHEEAQLNKDKAFGDQPFSDLKFMNPL